jgi:hypothetical protein
VQAIDLFNFGKKLPSTATGVATPRPATGVTKWNSQTAPAALSVAPAAQPPILGKNGQ